MRPQRTASRSHSALITAWASTAGMMLTASVLAPASSASTSSAGAGHDRNAATCEFRPTPERPAARPVTIPNARQKSHGTVDAVILTNYGPMVFELKRDGAPCAVGNLVHLMRSNFYDHTRCFRLTNSARLGVLQCGDIWRQEEGGPGYEVDDEVTPGLTYPRGTIAMGNQGPGTNGSEFFVVHSHAAIKPDYTVMGHLTYGFTTLDAIVKAGIKDGATDGLPAKPVRIIDAFVIGSRG